MGAVRTRVVEDDNTCHPAKDTAQQRPNYPKQITHWLAQRISDYVNGEHKNLAVVLFLNASEMSMFSY
jgi:hypothetical protein